MFPNFQRRWVKFQFELSNKLKSSGKRILFYTDSRGHDVLGKFKQLPKGSYVEYFFKKYKVDYLICPEKYTSIVDFLVFADNRDLSRYDYIILHCGVVDFSPRPLSNIDNVKASKINNIVFDELFRENKNYYENPTDTQYYNEKTINLYSPDFLKNNVIPRLNKVNNLIWIDSNHFVKDWEGNFTKGRPANIEEFVSKFDEIMLKRIQNVISIKGWKDEEVKKYTIDNIHFSKKGFKELSRLIEARLQKL